MTDLPHFLPYRMAYEVNQYFPLSYLNIYRPEENNYVLRFEVRRKHPVYSPVNMSIRIDMNYIKDAYPDAELCVIKFLDDLIEIMTKRIRPNTLEMMLQKYVPWMNSHKSSPPHPKTLPSADTSQPEPTQE
jgi:hypothetical protein